jgi:hypothetical protein
LYIAQDLYDPELRAQLAIPAMVQDHYPPAVHALQPILEK